MLGQEMIGEVIASTDVGEININTETQSVIGDKRYYGNNHLGNNSVTFTDRKLPEPNGLGGIDYFLADVTYFAEYYPYGMILRDGGDISSYTFQGQEVDNDVKGKGNSVNYKYRMHDVRTGRFFAVDPLAPEYPHNSPYAFSENVVIHAIELEGLEKFIVSEKEDGKPRLYFYLNSIKQNSIGRVSNNNGNLTLVVRELTFNERSLGVIRGINNLPPPPRGDRYEDLPPTGGGNNIQINQTAGENLGEVHLGESISEFDPINLTSTAIQSDFGLNSTGRLNFNVPVAGGATSYTMSIDPSESSNRYLLFDNFGTPISKNRTEDGTITGVLANGVTSINIEVTGRANDPADGISFSVTSSGPIEQARNIQSVGGNKFLEDGSLNFTRIRTTGVEVKQLTPGEQIPINE